MAKRLAWAGLALVAAVSTTPAMAQMRSVDPDTAIDGDLATPAPGPATASVPGPVPAPAPASVSAPTPAPDDGNAGAPAAASASASTAASAAVAGDGSTYREDDLIGAAEGVFGKGAKGLADVIRSVLKKQGEPSAYIVGREGGGALVVGLRYGSGTLFHKVEGQLPVYWTGPSVGFDAGANAATAFVLVYNLYDTHDLFKRFVAGEGQAYLVGGFNVSYLRRGDIVLIPVRVGAGLRLGANVGYMKFSPKQDWLPF